MILSIYIAYIPSYISLSPFLSFSDSFLLIDDLCARRYCGDSCFKQCWGDHHRHHGWQEKNTSWNQQEQQEQEEQQPYEHVSLKSEMDDNGDGNNEKEE